MYTHLILLFILLGLYCAHFSLANSYCSDRFFQFIVEAPHVLCMLNRIFFCQNSTSKWFPFSTLNIRHKHKRFQTFIFMSKIVFFLHILNWNVIWKLALTLPIASKTSYHRAHGLFNNFNASDYGRQQFGLKIIFKCINWPQAEIGLAQQLYEQVMDKIHINCVPIQTVNPLKRMGVKVTSQTS